VKDSICPLHLLLPDAQFHKPSKDSWNCKSSNPSRMSVCWERPDRMLQQHLGWSLQSCGTMPCILQSWKTTRVVSFYEISIKLKASHL
jgi:hypothetical protein